MIFLEHYNSNFFFKFFLKKKKMMYNKFNLEKKVWKKSNLINFNDVNYVFFVYNGINYYKFKISNNMIGFKIGEFIFTRKKHRIFLISKKKKLQKKIKSKKKV